MSEADTWYVVKQETGECVIVQGTQPDSSPVQATPVGEHWGPFTSKDEAIARRVGLIRAGKCKPA